MIQPDGVLPFQLDADAAIRHAHRWLERRHFVPGDLDEQAAVSPPRGVYMPFWSFDVGGEVVWQVMEHDSLTGEFVRWAALGLIEVWRSRSIAEVDGVTCAGIHGVSYDDLLVPASRSLPARLAHELTDFDTQAVLPYSADLLAGWPAEIYQVPLADASLVARQRAVDEAKGHARAQVGQSLMIHSEGVQITTYKLLLLPMWVTRYRYKGQDYLVAVNGQTGKVAGDLPRSGFQQVLASVLGDK